LREIGFLLKKFADRLDCVAFMCISGNMTIRLFLRIGIIVTKNDFSTLLHLLFMHKYMNA